MDAADRMVDDLLERWDELRRAGAPRPPEDFWAGVPADVHAEVERMMAVVLGGDDVSALVSKVEPVPLGVEGRYALLDDPEAYDEGGMGRIFLAEDLEAGRMVAYKVIRSRYADDPEGLDRFLNEPRITAQLEHPGIVPILGVVPDRCGLPAYAMEFIDGRTLAEAIADYREIDVGNKPARRSARERLLGHFIAACQIVAYAHSRRVVHGDVKPLNIRIDSEFDSTWLLDWGLARVVVDGERDGPETRFGTKDYLSPSERGGAATSFAGDIHALGVTLSQILDDPSRGGGSSQPLPARDTHPALWKIAEKARHPDRTRRHRSAAAVAGSVKAFLDDRAIPEYRDPWTTVIRRWLRRRPAVATALVFTLVIALLTTIAIERISDARVRELHERELARWGDINAVLSRDEAILAELRARSPAESPEAARAFLTLAESKDRNPDEIALAARLIRSASEARGRLGRQADAERTRFIETETPKRIAMLEQMIRDFPDHRVRYRAALANCYAVLGTFKLLNSARGLDLLTFFSRTLKKNPGRDARDADFERGLALYDKALSLIPDVLATPPFDQDEKDRWIAKVWAGRYAMLVFLGRYSEAIEALEQVNFYGMGHDMNFFSVSRTVIVLAAEKEQSHLRWSEPSRSESDHAKAVRLADVIARQQGVSPTALSNAACAYGLAVRDGRADDEERRRRADRAVELLRAALQASTSLSNLFKPKPDVRTLFDSSEFDAIRGREDFRTLAKVWAVKVSPGETPRAAAPAGK